MRRRPKVSLHQKTKPRELTATVNDAVAYRDVGKGRELGAEALCSES